LLRLETGTGVNVAAENKSNGPIMFYYIPLAHKRVID